MKKIVKALNAPQPIGAYSHAVKATGGLLFVSGQLPIDPVTNEMEYGGIGVQLHQIFANIKTILKAESLTLKDVVKCTVFMKDINDFPAMNQAYGDYFKENFPARSCVQVARLPKDSDIEVEVIAVYPSRTTKKSVKASAT